MTDHAEREELVKLKLTPEEIEWLREKLSVDPCDIGCCTPTVPTCICERRINALCDMALTAQPLPERKV